MSNEEFEKVLLVKARGRFFQSIIKSISINLGSEYSVDDAVSDIFMAFMVKNDGARVDKIKNDNGARISIENFLRNKYNTTKAKRGEVFFDKKRDIPNDELEFASLLGYNDMDVRLHYMFTKKNVKPRYVELSESMCKTNSKGKKVTHYPSRVTAIMSLINKLFDYYDEHGLELMIEEDELSLYEYINDGSRKRKEFVRNLTKLRSDVRIKDDRVVRGIYPCLKLKILQEIYKKNFNNAIGGV